jgi:hypothetical protein
MPRLAEQALDALGGTDPETVGEGIRLAQSIFESSHGQAAGLDRPEVVGEPATPQELAALRDRLAALVRSRPDDPVASAAVFTLGKLHDSGLAPFFTEVLRAYLDGDAGVLYQAMIALDNLGVEVFAGRTSMSVRVAAENRALAAAFLRRHTPG